MLTKSESSEHKYNLCKECVVKGEKQLPYTPPQPRRLCSLNTAAEDQHPLSSGQEVSRRRMGTWVSKPIFEHKFKTYPLN